MSSPAPAPILQHILRTPLPWQRPREALTECGKRAVDVAASIDFDEYLDKVKRQGIQRASLSTCMTCSDRGNYREQHDWSRSPSGALARAVARLPWRTPGDALSDLDRELLALAALAEAHRAEFEAYVDGLSQTVSIDEARRRLRRGGRS